MQMTIWYFADCPNWRTAGQRLRQALDQTGRTDVPITFEPVETEAQAAALDFAGSPTFTVDGTDLFDTAASTGTLTCRIYSTPGGFVEEAVPQPQRRSSLSHEDPTPIGLSRYAYAKVDNRRTGRS